MENTKYDLISAITERITYIASLSPFLLSFLDEHYAAIGALTAMFSFMVSWYYKHKQFQAVMAKINDNSGHNY